MAKETNPSESKPKKGWLQKLNSFVYEDSNEQTTDTPISVESNVTLNNNSVPSSSSFSYSTAGQNSNPNIPTMPNSIGTFDEKFYNDFIQVIESNNIDGVDYLEFSKAKKAMDNIPGMAEPVKFQSAFATLKANSNITKERLLETADFYLGKLSEEEKNFTSEMQNEVDSQVGARLNQAKSKQEDILRKQEQIAKLQGEIGALNGEIGTLNMEAQQIQSKIETTAKNFKVSLDVLRSQINLDKQNINTYIQ